jgi:hypothetical protein
VLHRVDEIETMPGPRFFAYCYRLTAYQGVIAAVHRRQRAAREQRAQAAPMSLGEWAAAHPAAIQAAHQEPTQGGR